LQGTPSTTDIIDVPITTLADRHRPGGLSGPAPRRGRGLPGGINRDSLLAQQFAVTPTGTVMAAPRAESPA